MYAVAAALVLAIHLVWLVFVATGVLFTQGRPWLTVMHAGALFWGIAVEIGPWPCPLTTLEQRLQEQAGMATYEQPFLVHYLERLVYPDIPVNLLVTAAVGVCVLNLAVYAFRIERHYRIIASSRRICPDKEFSRRSSKA